MKSVLGTFVIFFGIYIINYYDIKGFLAQPWIFYLVLGIVVFVLGFIVSYLLILRKRDGRNRDEENKNLP